MKLLILAVVALITLVAAQSALDDNDYAALKRQCGVRRCELYPTKRCKSCMWRCLKRRFLEAPGDIRRCLREAKNDECEAFDQCIRRCTDIADGSDRALEACVFDNCCSELDQCLDNRCDGQKRCLSLDVLAEGNDLGPHDFCRSRRCHRTCITSQPPCSYSDGTACATSGEGNCQFDCNDCDEPQTCYDRGCCTVSIP